MEKEKGWLSDIPIVGTCIILLLVYDFVFLFFCLERTVDCSVVTHAPAIHYNPKPTQNIRLLCEVEMAKHFGISITIGAILNGFDVDGG